MHAGVFIGRSQKTAFNFIAQWGFDTRERLFELGNIRFKRFVEKVDFLGAILRPTDWGQHMEKGRKVKRWILSEVNSNHRVITSFHARPHPIVARLSEEEPDCQDFCIKGMDANKLKIAWLLGA